MTGSRRVRSAAGATGAVFAAFAVWGCVGVLSSSHLERLEDRLEHHADRETAREFAPLAWSEALRYRDLARAAAERRERKQVERFAVLGEIQLRLAVVDGRNAIARRRLSDVAVRISALEAEEERLEAACEEAWITLERRAARAHLLEVVGAARLRAAAEEELLEHGSGGDEREARKRARRIVGVEMLARARVHLDLLGVLVDVGAIHPREWDELEAGFDAASARLGEGDLDRVRAWVERICARSVRAFDDAWSRLRATGTIADALFRLREVCGVATPPDGQLPFGLVWGFEGSPSWEENRRELEALGRAVRAEDDVHAFVLAAAGEPDDERDSTKRAERLARRAAGGLIGGGAVAERVHARGCGSRTPLKEMRAGETRFAVILVPLPGEPAGDAPKRADIAEAEEGER